ncbi:MAG: OmpA family protein, partial [Vibrionaceae bacterium]|nr:OmpA family protein [Vibrionaceae bacterium]
MKQWFLIVCSFLGGCGTISQDMLPGGNMLDTAPKTSTELRHPEWGYGNSSSVMNIPAQPTTNTAVDESYFKTSLEMFLDRHNIAHETISGGHLMVRLKDQVHFQTGSAQLS